MDEIKTEEKIKLGEEEYTQAQLSEMVGLAKSVQEAETKYNTKFDKVWPEYGRVQTEKKALEQKVADYESELTKAKQPVLDPTNQAQMRDAVDAAKRLGIVTKDDFESLLDQSFRKFYVRESAAKDLLQEANDLQEDINGKDGRPAFKTDEILGYMAETGIRNPQIAYKAKYDAELDAWKESKLAEAKKPGLYTQRSVSPGAKEPPRVTANKDNLEALISEQLYGPAE